MKKVMLGVVVAMVMFSSVNVFASCSYFMNDLDAYRNCMDREHQEQQDRWEAERRHNEMMRKLDNMELGHRYRGFYRNNW